MNWDDLRREIKGALILPGEEAFRSSARVYNSSINVTPAAILVPNDTKDISSAVKFAASRNLKITVKCGGHSSYGICLRSGALLISMQNLRKVTLDASGEFVIAEGGALVRDLDSATAVIGKAVPAGD